MNLFFVLCSHTQTWRRNKRKIFSWGVALRGGQASPHRREEMFDKPPNKQSAKIPKCDAGSLPPLSSANEGKHIVSFSVAKSSPPSISRRNQRNHSRIHCLWPYRTVARLTCWFSTAVQSLLPLCDSVTFPIRVQRASSTNRAVGAMSPSCSVFLKQAPNSLRCAISLTVDCY